MSSTSYDGEIAHTGRSTVVESIKADMEGPGCRCEYTNPLGRCCLKTVQATVAMATRSAGEKRNLLPILATAAPAPRTFPRKT